MTSSLTLSDYTSLTSDGQDWACPRCTAINSTNNVNCQACTEGRNPHHGNTDNLKELVIEQEKWFSQAAPKVERSITDRFKTFLGGWTCPVCKIDQRFGNSCTTCGHSLNPVKSVKPPKQSLKSQKSSSTTSLGNVFQSIRGSFIFNSNKKPVSASNLSTDTHLYPYPSSSVDKHRHTGMMVLVSKDEHGITDETISLEQGGEDCLPHIQPRPTSIDSGTYTMSDITSQASHLEPSDSRYNSPVSCTDLSKEAAWKCTVCSAFNRAVIGQLKCCVCNIGDAPRDIVPLLIQQKEYHQAIEVTNNEISPQPVHRNGPTNSSGQSADRKRRRTMLLHLTEANNETKLHRRSSWGDDCTPSPAKNCTQLMECKRREEISRANENYDRIRQHYIRKGYHQAIEVTNNETRLQNPSHEISTPQNVSPQPVRHDVPISSSRQYTEIKRRSSWGDDCTPSPAKNCTQLMECKQRKYSTFLDQQLFELQENNSELVATNQTIERQLVEQEEQLQRAEPTEIQLSDMLTDLHQVVGWFLLGVHLGVPLSDLQKIRHQFNENVDKCKMEMLITYSKLKEPSWVDIVDALRRSGERALAVRLARKHGVTLTEEGTESQEEESVSVLLPNGTSEVKSKLVNCIHSKESKLQNTLQQLHREQATKEDLERELIHLRHSLSSMDGSVGFKQNCQKLTQQLFLKERERAHYSLVSMDQQNGDKNIHRHEIDMILVEKDVEIFWMKRRLEELETQFLIETEELKAKLILLESEVTIKDAHIVELEKSKKELNNCLASERY
ncbi:uncharacterized protein LOC135350589 isoform X2 [Halichondria panicea]|uniref:uncharacterized protein LOC135350589 isoform X2 n=1 Tax=Halichondria panicea TaxID=6063 RepID=UPI00312B3150